MLGSMDVPDVAPRADNDGPSCIRFSFQLLESRNCHLSEMKQKREGIKHEPFAQPFNHESEGKGYHASDQEDAL